MIFKLTLSIAAYQVCNKSLENSLAMHSVFAYIDENKHNTRTKQFKQNLFSTTMQNKTFKKINIFTYELYFVFNLFYFATCVRLKNNQIMTDIFRVQTYI